MGNATNEAIQRDYSGIVKGAIKVPPGLTVTSLALRKGNILIKEFAKDEKTPGGIVLPDDVKTERPLAVVVKTFDGDQEFKCGDVVLLTFVHAGHEIEIEGQPLRILETFGELGGDILGHWPVESIES